MKEKSLTIAFTEYKNEKELESENQQLVASARKASSGSYSPYSKFHVGAAIRLNDGRIITASNQENVAYPSSMCAERVVLYYTGANFPDESIKAIAITANTTQFQFNDVVTPCGACRQVMAEYETRQTGSIKIILASDKNKILVFKSVKDLLPFMFKADQLRKE